MELVLPCVYAFLACAAFCVVFELRRWRYILPACFTGAVSWLVYLALPSGGVAVRCFFATMVVETLAQIFARMFKAPATIFLIIGIIPMVPGGGIYYTLEALINGDMPLFVQRGMETAASAGAIAVGCSLVSSVARIIALLRRERENRQNRDAI